MLLITGANGQLGTALRELYPDALAVDADVLDITDEKAVLTFARENRIDAIVNAAAYTAVDKAEDFPDLCRKVNVDGVRNLAKTGAKIVHISTDYVFDGKACAPYVETDATAPQSVYGQTKLEGEKALFETAENAVVLRTAWLYSPYGNNFVKTMRRLGAEREKLSVVFDQAGTPTNAFDLAQAVKAVLPDVSGHGLYHFSDDGVTSWYDFTVAILRLSGLTKCKVRPIRSAEYPMKAARPSYSVLDKTKIKKTYGIDIPHWQESLEKCLTRF